MSLGSCDVNKNEFCNPGSKSLLRAGRMPAEPMDGQIGSDGVFSDFIGSDRVFSDFPISDGI
jgi:hypothetical protein